MAHPIAGIPFDKRRLFAHEVLAVCSVVREALNTAVVCEPAKLLALYMALIAMSPEELGGSDVFEEGRLLFGTLEDDGSFEDPDPALLRVLLASMRANPRTDALDDATPLEWAIDGDTITH